MGYQGRILMMRHPQTVANTEHFFSGRRDVALTDHGREEREHGIRALEAFRPDVIYCSPISRCQDMARMAAGRIGCPVESWDDLIEIDFGQLEGKPFGGTFGVAAGVFPWPIGPDGRSQPAPDAESFEHLFERAGRVVERLVATQGRVACLTHGGFLRGFMAQVYQLPFQTFWNVHLGNVASIFLTTNGQNLALGGFNLTPEEVIARATRPTMYDMRDIWGAQERVAATDAPSKTDDASDEGNRA